MVDFGLAKGFERGRQKLNFSVVGTVDYMAPEIAAQCGHTQSADWWSFGIFAFDLFYGKPPDVSYSSTTSKIKLPISISTYLN